MSEQSHEDLPHASDREDTSTTHKNTAQLISRLDVLTKQIDPLFERDRPKTPRSELEAEFAHIHQTLIHTHLFRKDGQTRIISDNTFLQQFHERTADLDYESMSLLQWFRGAEEAKSDVSDEWARGSAYNVNDRMMGAFSSRRPRSIGYGPLTYGLIHNHPLEAPFSAGDLQAFNHAPAAIGVIAATLPSGDMMFLMKQGLENNRNYIHFDHNVASFNALVKKTLGILIRNDTPLEQARTICSDSRVQQNIQNYLLPRIAWEAEHLKYPSVVYTGNINSPTFTQVLPQFITAEDVR